MPRKTPASPAAKTAKTAKATKPAPKAVPKAAAPKAAVTSKSKTGVKTAVKAAARAVLAPPAKKTARKAAAPAAAPREPVSEARPVLVRDSFTMPEQEYAVLAEVKQACLRAGIDVKKSELLRIGVALLGQLDVATLKTVLGALPQLKTGRPPTQN
ncbi:hypothetical protein [Massilia sp. ZL223]|uniref:hypothetical protein n=1 Tax=Massilia sp. ZL223 TaxID=2824904 RepID=UPI001B811533|nr:hypothetical protein [Massilia sp. ZL223]MBQ5962967.1 hypothetical protein [Massilia sp. ZL223]